MTQLIIHGDEKLSAVKRDFNNLFPYLKLEFFRHRHKKYSPNPKSDLLEQDLTLHQVDRKAADLRFSITEDMVVADLERLFQEVFGVSAQVFRKSGRSWLETSVTDDWTLKRQNDEGMELSSFQHP